jgi:hypothetical protein
MRVRVRRLVGWAAIYAVALHTALLGVVPVVSGSLVASDPFSLICLSQASTDGDTNQTPGRLDHKLGHACEHCNLCSASVLPPAPDSLIGTVLPLRVTHVLRPVISAPRIGLTSDPKLARGPPQLV